MFEPVTSLAMQTAPTLSQAEADRIGVYIAAAIIGLLVSGAIALAKEARRGS